jgi:hypothetical protein
MDDDDGIVVSEISRAQNLRHANGEKDYQSARCPSDNVIPTAVDPNILRREEALRRVTRWEPVLHASRADPDLFI